MQEHEVTADPIEQLEEKKEFGLPRFKLVLQEYPFEIEDKDGKVTEYFLRELDAPQREEYQDHRQKMIEFNKQGNFKGLASAKGSSTKLLSMCMYERETNKLVSERFVRSLGSRTIEHLHNKALKLSGLNVEAEDDAKND